MAVVIMEFLQPVVVVNTFYGAGEEILSHPKSLVAFYFKREAFEQHFVHTE